ncbi:hypothetical protein Tco_0947309 [Tanacetum coccineum]
MKNRLDGVIINRKKKKQWEKNERRRCLEEKKDPGAFIFPIRLEGQINENALADTGSDTNTMPYRIYKQLGRDDIMKEDRNITMINYTEAEVTGRLTSGAYDHEAGSSHAKCSRNVETVEEALLPDVHHELLELRGCSREAKSRYNSSLKEAQTEEDVFFSVAWVRAFNIREPIYPELYRELYATYEFNEEIGIVSC